MKKTHQWLHALAHSNDTSLEQVRAHVFLIMLAAAFITMMVVLTINLAWWFTDPSELNRARVFSDVVSFVTIFVAFYFHQRRNGRVVRAVFLGFTVVIISFSLPPSELNRFLIAYALPVLCAGFIVSPTCALLIAGLALASYTGSWYWQGNPHVPFDAISMLFVVLIGFITWLVATFWENTFNALRNSEKELRTSNERFGKAFHANPTMMIINRLDNGVIIDVNASALRVSGYTRAEMVGRSLIELDLWADLAQRDHVLETIYATRALPAYPLSARTKTGDTIEVLGTAEIIELDGVPCIVSAFLDQTEQKRAQAALAEMNRTLEQRVRERTGELLAANAALAQEIAERKRVEQELALKAELLDAASDMIVLADIRGNIQYVNQAAQTWGWTPEKLMQGNLSLFQAMNQETHLEQRLTAFLSKGSRVFEAVMEKDGQPQYSEIHARVIHREGEPFILAAVRDITERKKAEQAAHASDEMYRAMFEKNMAVKLIVDPTTGSIVEANRAASEFYGYPSDELCALKITDLNILPPDQVHAEMARAKTEQRNYFNFPHRLKSGETRQVEVYSTPIPVQGKTLLYSIVHDITARYQTEQALRESEGRFRNLFEKASVAIFESSLDGKPIAVNTEFVRMFGYASPQEFIALVKNVATDLFADPNRRAEIIRLRAEHPEISTFENWYRRKDGSPFLGKLVLQNLSDANGTLFGFEGFIEDITERRKNEQALCDSEARFRSLFVNQPEPMFVVNTDTYRFIEISHAAIERYGYTRDEFLHMHLTDIRRDTPLLQVIAEWQGARHEFDYAGPSRHQLKDGRFIEVDLTVRLIEFDGQPAAIITAHDMTAQKQAEAALRESQARFQTLFDYNPEPVWVYDIDSLRFLEVNAAAVARYGYTRQEFLDLPITAIRLPDEAARIREHAQAIRAEREHHGFWQHRLKNGQLIDVQITAHVIEFDHREAVIVIAHDVTAQKQAEEALRKSEERLQLVFVASEDGFWDWSAQTNLVWRSPRCAEMLGFAPGQLSAEFSLWRERVHPDDLPGAEQAYRDHDAGLTPQYHCEYRQRTRTGEWLWIADRGKIVERDANGKSLRMVGVQSDIMARKQIEDALREREEQLRLVLESTQDGFWDWNVVTGEAQFSARWAEMLGYAATEIEPHVRAWEKLLHPDDAAQVTQALQDHFAGRTPFYESEQRLRAKSGDWKWVLDRGQVVAYDETGKPLRMVGTHSDITARKQAEDDLRESEARSRALLNALPDMMFIQSREGVYLDYHAPQAAQLAAPPELFLGKSMHQVLPPDLAARFVPVFEHTLSTNELQVVEYSLEQGGVPSHYEARTIKCGPDSVLTIVRDVTARKQAEDDLRRRSEELARANAQLTQANRLKDEFLAMMSHELRTPLNTILGMTEALQEQIYGAVSAEQTQALTFVRESGTHLLALINDILDLSKIEAGKMTLDRAPVLVESLCQASLRFIKQSAHKKQLRVSFTTNQPDAVIQADERLLKQALVNLLTNAVKFTPADGAIVLEMDCDSVNHVVRLIVSDTGIGIAPEDQTRLFRPFVQLDSQLNRQYGGTGLGLALVARIVALHDGTVTLESEPGRGSSFTITLPCMMTGDVLVPDAMTAPTPVTSPSKDSSTRLPVVLLADDNEDSLRWLSDYLQYKSFQVLVARNGRTAIELTRAHKPDVVLMDIQMPELDGLQAIQILRADPAYARTPIIALTALAMPGDRERCLQAGANDYLTKPIDLRRLLEILQKQLRGLE